jgi:hypothetical protein
MFTPNKFVKELLRNIFKLRTTVIDYAVAIFRVVVKFHLSCFLPSGLYLFHNQERPLMLMEMHNPGTFLKSNERLVPFFGVTKWRCRACFCELGKAAAPPPFKAFFICTRNEWTIMSFLQRAIRCHVDNQYPQRLHTEIQPHFWQGGTLSPGLIIVSEAKRGVETEVEQKQKQRLQINQSPCRLTGHFSH